LTASLAGVTDADGVPPASGFQYQWQVLNGAIWTNILGATNLSFTPVQDQVNHQVRVIVSFVDNGFSVETFTSPPTAVVGDLFIGGALTDNPTLTAGDDNAFGNGGNDTLDGGVGADRLTGGTGDDTYVVDDLGDVVTEAPGSGADTVNASINYVLTADVEALVLTGTATIGTGNGLDNSLTGNGRANTLTGLGGNDSLFGLGDDDTLLGGAGDDLLDGGAGKDRMEGGTGNDSYVVSNVADVVVEDPGAGSDQVTASIDYTLGANVENLVLTGAAITGTGNALDNRLTGNLGNNHLLGLDGNDTLTGGAGQDTMECGLGNDLYVVGDTDAVVVELASEGLDQVNASVSYTLAANVEILVLTGTGALAGTGSTTDNRIIGNAAANLINGLGGVDTLLGGAGDDTMVGGLGADVIDGGVGLDIFRFGSAAEGGDTILGFSTADDTIEVSAGGFLGGLVAGASAAGHFVLGTAANAATGQFLYSQASGSLRWDVDGTGATGSVLVATIANHAALTAADIQVIA
jgi:Ca2+-binding RTX toxin-like protein